MDQFVTADWASPKAAMGSTMTARGCMGGALARHAIFSSFLVKFKCEFSDVCARTFKGSGATVGKIGSLGLFSGSLQQHSFLALRTKKMQTVVKRTAPAPPAQPAMRPRSIPDGSRLLASVPELLANETPPTCGKLRLVNSMLSEALMSDALRALMRSALAASTFTVKVTVVATARRPCHRSSTLEVVGQAAVTCKADTPSALATAARTFCRTK
mmetsp:Transcript_60591/g.161697  ORF Transcript_60591/g.161697 Transcript_60591/m.161697 type:complete len:214 (-) Transcript_60591:911-1552(-)